MADVHVDAFPGEFMTLLGRGVLRAFYRWYVQQPGGIALIVEDPTEGEVLGLVAGGDPALKPRFMRRHAPHLALAALVASIRHRRARERLVEHVRTAARRFLSTGRRAGGQPDSADVHEPSEPAAGTWSNLLSICTAPAARGRGVGRLLMNGFRDESRRRGLTGMRLSVHNDNGAAIALYERCGWRRILVTPSGTFFWQEIAPISGDATEAEDDLRSP
jgi:ribosomal protein S18 acetylase RimI-like enzyme